MPQLDEMGLNEIMMLLKEKQEATQQGDLIKLIQLKKDYPGLFSKEFEDSVYSLVDNIEKLVNSSYFKEQRRLEKKKKFLVLDYPSWQVGLLDKALNNLEVIRYKNIAFVSQELIKEATADAIAACHANSLPEAGIEHIFPLLGTSIAHLLTLFPHEKREKMLKCAHFKLNVGENPCIENHNAKEEEKLGMSLFLLDEIKKRIRASVDKAAKKFDQREGFYTDCLFFSLLEISEFISNLAPHVAKIRGAPKELLIQDFASFMENV